MTDEQGKTPITQLPTEELPFVCGKCGRAFKSKPALTMHTIRKHSNKNWKTGANFASKYEKRRAYKRDYDLRKKAEKQRRPVVEISGINFCPECGCSLQAYQIAAATAQRINENARS